MITAPLRQTWKPLLLVPAYSRPLSLISGDANIRWVTQANRPLQVEQSALRQSCRPAPQAVPA
jgi:hypothetical protein